MTAPTPRSRHETRFATPTDLELIITRTFDAPRALVWAAFTEPRHFVHWQPSHATMPVCEMDLRPGGVWRYVYRLTNGQEHTATGIYAHVDPPRSFVQVQERDGEESRMTMSFAEENGRTTVTVANVYASVAAREQALKYAKFGAASSYERLDAYLPDAV